MKFMFGMVTFGCLAYTKRAIKSLFNAGVGRDQLVVTVGDPDDHATRDWLNSNSIIARYPAVNRGFAADVNGLISDAFLGTKTEWLLICGNDIEVSQTCFLRLTDLATNSNDDIISAYQVKKFSTFRRMAVPPLERDIFNCCLFKRKVFDRIGYLDANFWPSGYFSDNDYARRARLAKLRLKILPSAEFKHAVSATKKSGLGSTDVQFERCRNYYQQKWGGSPGHETLVPLIKIESNSGDNVIAAFWRNRK